MWAGISSSLGAWVEQEQKEEGPGWSPQGGERKHDSTASHLRLPASWRDEQPPPLHTLNVMTSCPHHKPKAMEPSDLRLTPLKPRVTMNLPSFGLLLSILLAIATGQQLQKRVWSSLKTSEFGPDTPLACCSQPGLWGTGHSVFLLTSFKNKDVLQHVLK